MDTASLLWGGGCSNGAAKAAESAPLEKEKAPAPPATARKRRRRSDGGATRAAKGAEHEPDAADTAHEAGAPEEAPEPEQDSVTFPALGLSTGLCNTLQTLSIVTPTPVQREAIPLVIQGRDICATACTGSGKTAAFALPILDALAKDPYGVFALCLTPARELAQQVAEQFSAFGARFGVQVMTLVGGLQHLGQQRKLETRPHIVVGTPGRVRATLDIGETKKMFRRLRYLVIDEADRILDGSFDADIEAISAYLPSASRGRQTLLFSATLSEESLRQDGALRRIGWGADHKYAVVDTGEREDSLYKTADKMTEMYAFVPMAVKLCALVYLLSESTAVRWRSCMVFVSSCRECEVVRMSLQELGLPVVSIDSLLPQRSRQESLVMFKLGDARILVGTDVASRGLDIPRVDLVVNYDVPNLSRNYVHRAGRTARAGRAGSVISIVTERDVRRLHRIEAHIGRKLQEFRMPDSKVTELLDDVTQARTRAKVNVNQQFGDRLREAEDRAPRNTRSLAAREDEMAASKRAHSSGPAPGSAGAAPPAKRRRQKGKPASKPAPKPAPKPAGAAPAAAAAAPTAAAAAPKPAASVRAAATKPTAPAAKGVPGSSVRPPTAAAPNTLLASLRQLNRGSGGPPQ
eukprot:TRINITY_DN9868_c0_g1_i1.p1 TRINITY_DN9868_c0_g1~~TRINITY_DN9868_c0_g1_i1.p1  ORF type:complete len:652 (+),score=165.97 TRINITY_DN9868_c0_g1_i1:52-1956(+)